MYPCFSVDKSKELSACTAALCPLHTEHITLGTRLLWHQESRHAVVGVSTRRCKNVTCREQYNIWVSAFALA